MYPYPWMKPDLTPILKEREKDFEDTEALYYATEMECFRFFEQSRQIHVSNNAELEALLEEKKEILQYYNVSDVNANLVRLFSNNMNGMKNEENEKLKRLNDLKNTLSVLEREAEEEKNRRKKPRQITIYGSITQLRDQLEKLRQFYENIKIETIKSIHRMKAITRKLIEKKKEEAQKQIQMIQKDIDELNEKKQWYLNIPNYVKEHSHIQLMTDSENTFTIEPNFSKINQVTKEAQNKLQDVFEKHKNNFFAPSSQFYTQNYQPIFDKLTAIEAVINRIISKIQSKSDSFNNFKKEISSKSAIYHWLLLYKKLVIKTRVTKAINERQAELDEEQKLVSAELQRQRKIANEIVPGTNKTVLQLRKEIMKLSKQVSDEKAKMSSDLLRVQQEYKEYAEFSRQQIENLEKETNVTSGKV